MSKLRHKRPTDGGTGQDQDRVGNLGDIVKHRRDRVRYPSGETQMVVDVFFQYKTQEFRDQKRSPNRDQDARNAAQSNAEGADCEVRVQRHSNRRDERIS
jgi:hypothetical protein